MNEELFNEASRSNVLSKKLVDQLQESMSYSSISFINWTIEVLKLLKARIERGDKLTDEPQVLPMIFSPSVNLWRIISLITLQARYLQYPSERRRSTSPWSPVRAATTLSWQMMATRRPTAGSPASVNVSHW